MRNAVVLMAFAAVVASVVAAVICGTAGEVMAWMLVGAYQFWGQMERELERRHAVVGECRSCFEVKPLDRFGRCGVCGKVKAPYRR